jgi:hypothetical protein
MTGVTGDMTDMAGDMTGIEGQPPAEMIAPEGDQGMGAMDGAFGDSGDIGTPPPSDDPMGAALDDSSAASDAGGAAGGQGTEPDPLADMPDPGMDPGMDQPDDDQGGGAIG